MRKAELYLPRVEPRWPTAAGLVAALGCTAVLAQDDDFLFTRNRSKIGDAPAFAQLMRGGEIRYFPEGKRTTSFDWSFIAHEAVHYHAGRWSIEDETPMLPFELELIRRIGKDSDRHACLDYLANTRISWIGSVSELFCDKEEWVRSREWNDLKEECERKRLPMDGRLRGELKG